MEVRRMRLAAPCPACRASDLLYTAAQMEIPYFGDIIQTLILCTKCGFKHGDVVNSRTTEAMRYVLHVDGPEDLDARIVRSTSGTIRVPELGLQVEPGPNSDSYVSNVEGVLRRFEAVVQQLCNDAEDEPARIRCQQKLHDLDQAIQGSRQLTIVIEDPHGNSLIVHRNARAEPMSPEDAARLATGETLVDLSELDENDKP